MSYPSGTDIFILIHISFVYSSRSAYPTIQYSQFRLPPPVCLCQHCDAKNQVPVRSRVIENNEARRTVEGQNDVPHSERQPKSPARVHGTCLSPANQQSMCLDFPFLYESEMLLLDPPPEDSAPALFSDAVREILACSTVVVLLTLCRMGQCIKISEIS